MGGAICGLIIALMAACSTLPAQGRISEVQIPGSGVRGYTLGSGDEVKVTIFDEPDLSGTFVVDGQGTMTLPLIGQIDVANLSVNETSRLLETRLRDGWLRDPKVSAELVKGRPYYILGEVNKPGEYAYVAGLTVMKAVASAGGFAYRADKSGILVKSADSPNEREVELSPTTPVQPGDTIRIRERFF
jgi:polysaccharide export outer membrane protein